MKRILLLSLIASVAFGDVTKKSAKFSGTLGVGDVTDVLIGAPVPNLFDASSGGTCPGSFPTGRFRDGCNNGLSGGVLIDSFQPRLQMVDRSSAQTWWDLRTNSTTFVLGWGNNSDFFTRLGDNVIVATALDRATPQVAARVQHNAITNIGTRNVLTISGGILTIGGQSGFIQADTEGAASTDDLDTINIGSPTIGAVDGDIIILKQANAGRDVTVKHNTGNIWLNDNVDYVIDDVANKLVLMWDSQVSGGRWVELTRTTTYRQTVNTTFTFNGAGGTSSSVGIRYDRNGDWITIHVPVATATTGTTSLAFIANTALPVGYRPLTLVQTAPVAQVTNNNTTQTDMGILQISTAGILTLFRDATGTAWTNTATGGFRVGATYTFFVGSGS